MGRAADAAVRAWATVHARSVTLHSSSAQVTTSDPPERTAAGGPPDVLLVEPAGRWPGHAGGVSSLTCAMSADSRLLLASGGEDGEVKVWDQLAGEVVGSFPGAGRRVASLAWCMRAGKQLLAASMHGGSAVQVWDVRTGTPAFPPVSPLVRSGVRSVAWVEHTTGLMLMAASADASIQTWDGRTGAAFYIWPGDGRAANTTACAIAPGVRPMVAFGDDAGTVTVRDGLSAAQQYTLVRHARAVSSVAWGEPAGGGLLLATCDDRDIRVWDGISGILRHTISGHGGLTASMAWANLPDGTPLLASTTGQDETVLLWDGRSGALLHTFNASPLANDVQFLALAWAERPDGQLTLYMGSATGDICAGRVSYAPPKPPAAVRTAPSVSPIDLPEDPADLVKEIVPAGWAAASEGPASAVAWAVTRGGALLATGGQDGARVWDGSTGELLLTLTDLEKPVQSVAWAVLPDESLLLAAGCEDGDVQVWDGRTGELLFGLPAHSASVRSVAWAVFPDARPLLASGSGDGTARVTDGRTGAAVAELSPGGVVWSVAWAVLPDTGQPLLATSSSGSTVTVWDGRSGAEVRQLSGHTGDVNSVAWVVLPDGRLRLASGSDDGSARVWDGRNGTLLHTFTEDSGAVCSVRWAVPANGHPLLVTAGRFDGKTTRIWDGRSYAHLASLPGARGIDGGLAWATLPGGRELLATTPGMSQQRARIWDTSPIVPGTQPPPARRRPVTPVGRQAPSRTLRLAEAGLFALGRADLWPPLGLVTDLITLTGPASVAVPELNDGRLRALGQHPGIRRLQALGWPARARLSFAALLASGVTIPAAYHSPGGAQADLRDALVAALASPRPARAADINLEELRAAASAVDDRTVALLTILGPGAASADPVLPLLLAHQAPRLPVLAGSQLRMLSEVSRSGTATRRESDGGLQHAPGTAGIGRHGRLSQLLPTQLALPADMLTARYLQGHLLYRRHTAHVPVTPERVTLILDTTPPTYGPAENILRLAAHLITTVLWEFGEYPEFVSLAQPAVAAPLTGPANLAQLWTTRTLDPPGPAITTAMDTARATGTRLVLLTHHHTADRWFLPGPGRQLLTTHHPAEPPPPPPARPDHYHLPPNPAQTLLIDIIWSLITPRGSS